AGIRDFHVTGVQTCALPICPGTRRTATHTPAAVAAKARSRFMRPSSGVGTVPDGSGYAQPPVATSADVLIDALRREGMRVTAPQIGRASCRQRVAIWRVCVA